MLILRPVPAQERLPVEIPRGRAHPHPVNGTQHEDARREGTQRDSAPVHAVNE